MTIMTCPQTAKTMVIALVAAALLTGCATLDARRRLQEYDEYFSPLIGTARHADIIRKFGEPVRRDKLGKSEFWYYHIPARDRSNGQGSGGIGGGYATGSDRDIYDDLTIEFDAKGILKGWRGYIQR